MKRDIFNVYDPTELWALPNETSGKNAIVHLHILAPLHLPRVLAACRKKSASQDQRGHEVPRPQELRRSARRIDETLESAMVEGTEEILDLDPLFKDWRYACSRFPSDPAKPLRFVFNITLPDWTPGDRASKLTWGCLRGPGMWIKEHEVELFVTGIAGVVQMKCKGATFALEGAEEYARMFPEKNRGNSPSFVSRLEETLLKLSERN